MYLAGRNVGHIQPLGTWTYPLMQLLGAGQALPFPDEDCEDARNHSAEFVPAS